VYYTGAHVNPVGVLHPEGMPGRGTPMRAFRLAENLWIKFGEAAAAAGVDRGTLLRAFVAWYLREPGAKLPDRPK